MTLLPTEINQFSEEESQGKWNDNVCVAVFSIIHHQKGDRGNDGDRKFMPPTDIKNIIEKSEHCRYQQGQNARKVNGKL